MQQREIERKQQRRWHDLIKDKPTPLLDDLALQLNLTLTRRQKKLLQLASFIDHHLQRDGSERDLPGTHTVWLAAYLEFRRNNLDR